MFHKLLRGQFFFCRFCQRNFKVFFLAPFLDSETYKSMRPRYQIHIFYIPVIAKIDFTSICHNLNTLSGTRFLKKKGSMVKELATQSRPTKRFLKRVWFPMIQIKKAAGWRKSNILCKQRHVKSPKLRTACKIDERIRSCFFYLGHWTLWCGKRLSPGLRNCAMEYRVGHASWRPVATILRRLNQRIPWKTRFKHL